MYLVINKCVTAVKVSNFSGYYLRNRSTLDIRVLGYIDILQHKEHSPEVWHIPPETPCIYTYIGNKSFERVEYFNYLGTSLMNQNSFHAEIKCKLQSGNTWHHLVQNLSSSSLLSKNIKVQIYGTIILPFVFYGYDTWSPTVSEKHRLRVFGNRVLRKVFGPTRDEVTGEWGR